MPLIAKTSIDKIATQINIYDVVSQVVSLKKAGRQFRGLSPFSNEKTPSFYINPEKNVFYCYSTGQGGGVIRFIQLYEKLTFVEAMETLAERFQINLEYEDNKAPGKNQISRSLRKEIIDIHEYACEYYNTLLSSNTSDSLKIREYWVKDRQFPESLINEFKIGLSPVDDTPFVHHIVNKKFSLDALQQCGLFFFSDFNKQNPQKFRARFKGRLMIPIRNYQSQVIAFTARKLDITPAKDPSAQAKYINSPETPVFHKSNIVFGLDIARNHIQKDDEEFILVEGQLDAIRCWHRGLKTAVAPQGTAITEEQLLLLKRYSDRLLCLLDGDSAGQKAAMRMLPIALKAGLDVRFLLLPNGDDPDTYLTQNKLETFLEIRKQSLSAMAFAAKALLPDKDPSPQLKTVALHNIYNFICECDNTVTQKEYLNEAATCLNVDKNATHQDFNRFRLRNTKKQRYNQAVSNEKKMKKSLRGG